MTEQEVKGIQDYFCELEKMILEYETEINQESYEYKNHDNIQKTEGFFYSIYIEIETLKKVIKIDNNEIIECLAAIKGQSEYIVLGVRNGAKYSNFSLNDILAEIKRNIIRVKELLLTIK